MPSLSQLISEVLVKDSASGPLGQISAAMDKTAAAEGRVQAGAAGVESTMARSSATIDRAARSWTGLQSRLDTQFAAQQKIANVNSQVERAVALGIATQARGNEIIAAANEKYSEHVGIVDRLKGAYAGLNSALGIVGISIAAAAVVQFGLEAVKAAASIQEMASRAGFSAAQFQGLQFAAAKAGIPIDEMDTALARFTRSIGAAAEGNKAAIEAFDKLHIGILDADNVTRGGADAFTAFAKAIAEIPEPARRATLEVALLGRSGQSMDELIVQFGEGKISIDQLAEAARKAGFSFDDPLIKKAKEAEGEIETLKREAEVFAVTWISVFIKALETEAKTGWIKQLEDSLNELNAAAIRAGQAVHDVDWHGERPGLFSPGSLPIAAEVNVAPFRATSPTGPHPFSGDLSGLTDPNATFHNPASAEALNKAAEAAKRLATEYDALLGKINPVVAANEAFDKGIVTIDAAIKAGLAPMAERGALVAELTEHYRDALDPVAAAFKALDQELAGLKLTDAEREIHNKLLAEENALRKAGIEMTPQQIKAYDAELRAIQAQDQANKLNTDIAGQQDQLSVARANLQLVGATNAQRAVAIAGLEAENELRRQGIALGSTEAQQYIANAQAIAQIGQQTDQQKAIVSELDNFSNQAFDRIGTAITTAFAQGTISVTTFGDIAKSVLSEIEQEIIKLSIINPLKNLFEGGNLPTLSSVVGSLFGSGSSAGGLGASANRYGGVSSAAGGGLGSLLDSAGSWIASLFHEGGTVGMPGPGRLMPAAAFAGAPRYHDGGWAGFEPDEVPAVLRRGESVRTARQEAALQQRLAGGEQSITNINHFHFPPNTDVDSFRRSTTQVAAQAGAAMRRAMARTGR